MSVPNVSERSEEAATSGSLVRNGERSEHAVSPMDIKITYLDTVPQVIPRRYPNQLLQSTIEEFMKTDKPTMRIDIGDHYKNLKAARGAWVTAIRRSGYKLAVYTNNKENCVYIIKPDPTGKEEE